MINISRCTNIHKSNLIVDSFIQENNTKRINKDPTDTYEIQIQQTARKKYSHTTRYAATTPC